MKVRLLSDRWDQPVDGGYEQHVKGDVVDVATEVGEWLVASGSGAVVEPKPAPADDVVKPAASKRSRRKASNG